MYVSAITLTRANGKVWSVFPSFELAVIDFCLERRPFLFLSFPSPLLQYIKRHFLFCCVTISVSQLVFPAGMVKEK